MSICKTGLDYKFLITQKFMIEVSPKHPLIKLMNTIDWQALVELILPDLKASTSKMNWWLGRKLKVRSHLGVFLLQQLLNETDRGIERQVHDNAVYAIFCGKSAMNNWHCPDHTKIQEFRSRLTPQTQCSLVNAIAQLAAKKGFAKPEHIDVDSTVQEPDMQYPATINLLVKTAVLGRRVQKIIQQQLPPIEENRMPHIDMKKIMGIAKEYYFEKRRSFKLRYETKNVVLKKMWQTVANTVQPVIRYAKLLLDPIEFHALNKREQQQVTNFVRKAPPLLDDCFEHCFNGKPYRSDIFSYHLHEVNCFNKMKRHKVCEFGRQFQIGRIGGNFVFSMPNTSIRMLDAASLKPMLVEHINLFQQPIETLGTDKPKSGS